MKKIRLSIVKDKTTKQTKDQSHIKCTINPLTRDKNRDKLRKSWVGDQWNRGGKGRLWRHIDVLMKTASMLLNNTIIKWISNPLTQDKKRDELRKSGRWLVMETIKNLELLMGITLY